jgi:hypothetical protein
MKGHFMSMNFRPLVKRFLDLPLRMKFILSFLLVISFGGLISLFFGGRLEHRTIFDLAQAKVRHDLASAWMVYNEKLNDIRDIVLLNSSRDVIQAALLSGDRETLRRTLGRVLKDFHLDILTVTDGQVTTNPETRWSAGPSARALLLPPRSFPVANCSRKEGTSPRAPISGSSPHRKRPTAPKITRRTV